MLIIQYVNPIDFKSYFKPSSPTDDVYLIFEEYYKINELKLDYSEDIITRIIFNPKSAGLRKRLSNLLKYFQNGF